MRIVLAVTDLLGAFIMLALALRVTAAWGARTTQGRWGMARRCVYCLVAVALFIKGIDKLQNPVPVDLLDGVTQLVIVGALIMFPLLRALNLLSQDKWGRI